MRAAFPYMGSIHIPIAAIIRALGGEAVVPPPPDSEAVQTGVRLAPELMCIPFKITLGNMVRCLEAGADTLVYTGGSWSCRYGYYGPLQYEIIREAGYRARLLLLRRDRLGVLVATVLQLAGGSLSRAVLRAVRAARLGWYKSLAVDTVDACWRRELPRVADHGECNRLRLAALERIDRCDQPAGLKRIVQQACRRLQSLPRGSVTAPLRVRIVGESYCVIEPYVTFDIVRRLGELGVEAQPFLTAHRWLGFHGLRLDRAEVIRARQAARRWWQHCVGGEDENSIGQFVLAAEDGYDGVIHVGPFGCMPGTVAQPTLERLSERLAMPYLALSFDEHTAEAGVLTRLEAFVTMIERRRHSFAGSRRGNHEFGPIGGQPESAR